MNRSLRYSKSVPVFFREVAFRQGDKVAVESGDCTKTYAELDRSSELLAARLVQAGVLPGDLVGVAGSPDPAMIVSLLAILKAGAGYVPLSEHYPVERLRLIAEQAQLKLVLGTMPGLEETGVPQMTVDPDQTARGETPEIFTVTDVESPAYVMYTSGTTGTPKGVVVPHRAVLRLVLDQDFAALGPDERILQNSPIAFDAATFEIWGALLNGGTLVFPDTRDGSLRGLGETIRDRRITTLWLTAGLFHAMAEQRPQDFAPLRQLLTGGDVVSPAKVARVMDACPGLTVINGYGPTENTTFTCCHTITREEAGSGRALPIGRAIRGTEVFILDETLEPVEPGTPGELCASGSGLALGYLARPDLTAEKFVAAPWDRERLLYRTGDLARQDADGVVHYLDRIDTQVKIRGFRVEPGEIETALEACAGIRQAAVIARPAKDRADRMLVAFCVADAAPDEAALRRELAQHLPDYAVPARIVRIDALPLGLTGKVDRRALEAMPLPAPAESHAAAKGGQGRAIEHVIVRHLAQVLDVQGEEIDETANFFDLGASSLHLAQVHERVQTELDRSFPIGDFFAHSSVAALAAHLSGDAAKPAADSGGTPAVADAPGVGSGLIAIIAVAGRFPGAPDVETFWDGLVNAREMISHFTPEELEFDPARTDPGATTVPARGIMEGADLFDARLFDIPPREAERLDPQHRILLEVAQTALDKAGHDPARFGGRIGIFAGASQSSYLFNNLLSGAGASRRFAAGYPVQDFATLFGNDKDFLSTRIAYKLNLRGPAVTVQCACSTSLVAVAQACESLRRGTSDMALAGGVSVTFPTRRAYRYEPEGMASDDGHCRTFDAEATGTVFGDGAGLVVLRRLEDALADGDEIIAVIRGFSINNDGSEKAGYAAPSIKAQAEVIRAAQRAAGVEPRSIGYVEAHGTATPLGDPIEFAALHEAFSAGTDERGFCALGSAKTNVGHLDIAAGVTGLIKTALTLKHGVIPPLLHFKSPNPRMDFASSAFFPAAELTPWVRGETPRRAGVSAFGVGGTNIHMILEEAPLAEVVEDSASPAGLRVFPVSASTPEALKAAVADLGAWAERHPEANQDAVLATLREGRREFAERAVLVADGMAGLAQAARGFAGRSIKAGRRPAVAFLFPGQGAQHVGMARELFAAEPVFRAALSECVALLEPELGLNLLDVIHAPAERAEAATAALKNTALAQPAIFAIGYALAKQWEHWGIRPDAMIGHSIGEFAAATLAGVIDLPDALRLITLRGRLMAGLPTGVMASVRASEEELLPFLGAGMDLAAVNGAKLCVLAGPDAAAEAILPKLEAAGFVVSRLHTSHAFHSQMMDPAIEPFREAVSRITLRGPNVPILSSVTGDWLTAQEATDPDYWAQHMRKPVRFHDAIQRLWAEGRHIFVETGPGRTLSTLAAQSPGGRQAQPAIASLPHAQAEGADSHASMLEAFGHFWAHGRKVDWARIDGDRPKARRAAGLPTYPFQRARYWVEPAEDAAPAAAPAALPGLAEAPAAEAPAAPPANLGDAIRAMLADLSGFDPAEMDGGASFLELGFDSLLLTQATRELKDRFRVTITLRQLIDGMPSIDALAAHIEAQGWTGSAAVAAPAAAPKAEAAEPAAAQMAPSAAPLTRIDTDAEALTPQQRAHIDRLVARYVAKTPKSKALTAQYRPVHADPRTASGFSRLWKELVYQIVSVKSKGSRLIDVDGNEYIDILNGFGPGFLGHAPDFLVQALHGQLDQGFEVGPQSLAAMEAAALFCEVTGNDRASFVCTGSEAVYAAMRLARTCTGRDKIVMFARDYHGNFDEVLVRGIAGKDGPRTLPLAPGIPADSLKNIVVLPYGTPEALDYIQKNADSLAAVIVEPVQSRRPEFRPAEFVREVRHITERSGTLFVFDEVVTGFRFGPRGAQGYYGVDADLVTYGKVVGGGMPVGVVSGRARFMDTFDGGQWAYGDASFPEAPVTFFAGTFVRHPLAMASVRAMLQYLKAQPEFFWRTVNAKGDRLAGTVDRWFEENDMPFRMPNCGSLMYLRIGEDQKHGALIGAHLRDRGVFILEGFPSYMTAAHDDADIDHVIEAMKDSALEMRAGGLLTGREAVAYDGPKITHLAPRLSLPGGEAAIAAAMTAPPPALQVPATEAQREIWAALVVNPEVNPAYNESVTLGLSGPVDCDSLRAAVMACVERHDALRSGFSADGATMVVKPRIDFDIPVSDLSGMAADAQAAEKARLLRQETETPFDLVQGPLLRARLVVLAEDRHELVLTAHHIICDGWSIAVILRDISAFYSAFSDGERPALPPSQSIVDYATHAEEMSRRPSAKQALDYWHGQFAEAVPRLDLPTDHARSQSDGARGTRIDRALPERLIAPLRAMARKQGATFVNLMLAAYALHVARLAQADDLVVGLPSAGQATNEMPGVVGHCVNLLPIRARIDWDAGFDRLLGSVRGTMLDAFSHPNLTFGELVRSLRLPREAGRVPLVSVVMNIDNGIDLSQLPFGAARPDITSNPRAYEHFDLFLNITDSRETILTEWSFRTDLFEPATVHGWIDGFERLLEQLTEDPTRPLGDLGDLPQADRIRLLADWQGRTTDYPREATLATLFADRLAQAPGATALVDVDGREVSFAALDAQANAIAARLRAQGVVPGDVVGVCLERSALMVAAMLAALRLGAAWLPLDPGNPAERIRHIVADAGPRTILSLAEVASRLKLPHSARLDDLTAAEIAEAPAVAPVRVDAASAAYVIYTSGSTGRPKGVIGTHRATINRFVWMWRAFPFAAGEVMCQKTAISFVDSIWEIFGPLLAGVPQVIVPDATVRDPGLLLPLLGRHRVTRLLVVPSLLRMLADSDRLLEDDAPALRLMFTSGEALSAELARAFLATAPQITLVNLYGSSEVAADVTWEVVSLPVSGEVPIGRPIDNARLYVLDARRRLLPPGSVGELYVGGDVLAAGYLNSPGLTQERFLPDPFSAEPGAVMFATGDRVRWLADGRLMYEGRRDHQVKLRGYRIELGEIESRLAAMPEVSDAVATLHRAGANEPSLVAFVAAQPGMTLDAAVLRGGLCQELPPYMVPDRVVVLERMPLNSSGKIDRGALATWRIESAAPARALSAPASATERALHDLWCTLLDQSDIGVDDNFFLLGGHSLLAVRLFTRIRKDEGIDLPISTLFEYPTIRSLASRIDALSGADGAAARPAARRRAAKGRPAAAKARADLEPWDTTVVINPGPGNGERPLFIVGGVGGNVNNLFELGTHLGRNRPVVGLQTRGVLGHRMHDTMEDMAADHIANIRRHQPVGPYLLAGYSGGAFTAFEMARQLVAAGERVDYLGALDMYAPGFVAEKDKARTGRLQFEIEKLRKDGLAGMMARVRPMVRRFLLNEKTVELGARLAPDRFRLKALRYRWVRVAKRYAPGPYAGDLHLYASVGDGYADARTRATDPLFGWTALVRGKVLLVNLAAGHLSLLRGERALFLADRIEEDIRQGSDRHAG